MRKNGRKRKLKQYDKIINEHINKNLFYDIVDEENETKRNFYRVPESEKYKDAGIKAALMLQFEPFFETIIKVGICIGFVFVTKDLCIALSGKRKTNDFEITDSLTLYSFDVIYLLDVLLMISYKSARMHKVNYLYTTRHMMIVIIELVSIVPLEIVYMLNAEESEFSVYCILRLRYCVRLIRLFYGIVQHISTTTLVRNLIAFSLITIFSVIVSTTVLVLHGCWYFKENQMFNCDDLQTEDILNKAYRVAGKIVGVIIDEDFTSITLSNYLCFVSMIDFIFFMIIMGRLTFYFIQLNLTSFKFTAFRDYTTNFLMKNRKKEDETLSQIDKLLPQTLTKYITMLLDKHVRTISLEDSQRSQIIPDIIYKEVTCDIYWDALKHVELFCNMPAEFLRYISTLVVHQFYTEGEPIYTRSENMGKMVFIMHGIVKVHSEVNGETPIISFTNGTVLGASTLALSRNSTTYVTSHNFCETVELHRKDFIKACVNYPHYVHDISAMIMHRCQKAKEYLRMSKFQCELKIVDENKELLSIRYIKHKLRVLLGKDIEKVNTQQIWSYGDQRILENEERSIFCSDYIRNYVITTDHDLDPDINFMRRGLYFKFKPESPILTVWNYIIVALALFTNIILPYYISFKQRMTGAYIIFVISITFIWFLDMLMQLVTGVETGDNTINEFLEIFKYRMSSCYFLVDIVACIPLEALIYVLEGDISVHVALMLQMNRMLKIYRFSNLCNQGHWNSIRKQLYMKYVKYIVILVYWIYFIAAILNFCLEMKLSPKDNIPYKHMLKYLLYVVEFLTGVDVHKADKARTVFSSSAETMLVMVMLQLSALCIRMYIVSDLAAAESLCQMRRSQFLSFCGSLKSTIKCFNLDKVSEKRLWANVNLQWLDNQAEHILKKTPLKDLSARLHELLNYSAFGHHLHRMELLKDLPDNIIRTLCLTLDIRVIPCDEVVTYAGDNAREMYLILQGFCSRVDTNGEIIAEDVLTPGSSISVLEMLYGYRSTCTVIAVSDCKMAVFERNKFINEMTRYPEYLDEIMESLWCSVTRADLEHIINIGAGVDKYKVVDKPVRNFFSYKYLLSYGTRAYYTYLYPFPRRLHFLRYFVFRTTISNYGTFIFYYEIVRCICAYLTCVLGSFAALTNCSGMYFEILFNILDATAWIDIVVRHYICYYDSRCLQERHPVNTILYYWSHGFLVDLFGVIPFDSFVNANRRFYNQKPIAIYIWNRCLQLYRPYFLKIYIKSITKNSWLIACLLDFLQVLLVTILVNQFVGRFNGLEYQITSDQFGDEFYKEMDNLVTTASLFLNVGYKSVVSLHNDIIIIAILYLGHIYIGMAISKAIGTSLFCNVDITTYQGKMNHLVKFLSYRSIDKSIKDEIIKHFEYIWLKRRGKVIHDSIETLNTAFKEDILYAVYGKAVKLSSVFHNAPKAFIQNYLLHVQHITFLRRAVIYKVNDVHGLIYFLFKGHVDVLGPDKCILTKLTVGSFFGCLDRCLMSRQTLTMVARGHCEVLTINSLMFHQILTNFRDLRKAFREATSMNVDFVHGMDMNYVRGRDSYISIRSCSSSVQVETNGKTFMIPLNKTRRLKRTYRKLTSVITKRKFHRRWQLTIVSLTFVCFILEIYQKVTLETNTALIVVLYLSDLLTLYKIYIEFQLAVQDEYGNTVTARSLIAKKYRNAYVGLYFDVATVMPLELLIVPFVTDRTAYFTAFRCNRLFRIIVVFLCIYNHTMKLNVNVYVLRTTLAFLMLFTVQQLTNIGLVRNKLMEREKNSFYRYMWVNSISLEIICLLLVPSAIIEGNSWYKMFIVIKISYLRICLLYFISACTTALFMSYHNSFVYWSFTERLIIFMKRLKISKPLLDRVVAYIKLFWIFQRGIQFPQFLTEAPYYLREAVLNSMFGFHIEKQPILGQLHIDLLRQMVALLRTKTFFPGDFVAFVGDIDETMYFLHEGEIVSLSEDNLYEEVVMKTFGPGDMFGLWQGVLKHKGHDCTYRATKYTVLLLLTRSLWFHLIDFFPASKRFLFNNLNVFESDLSLNRVMDTKRLSIVPSRKITI